RLAASRGFRLNARFRDPILSAVLSGVSELDAGRGEMRRAVAGRLTARRLRALAERLRRTGAGLGPTRGQALGRILDEAESFGVFPLSRASERSRRRAA